VAGFAQVETTNSITGNVIDQQGAAFAGAIVKLSNQKTGALRDTATNSEGVYSFQSLQGGTYTISVSAKGFKTTTVTDRTVETAQPAHLDLKLEIGATSDQITVSGAGAELVNTASAEVTGSVTRELVENIPLGRGNFFDLLQLTPGTVPQNFGSTNVSFAQQSLNFVQAGNTFQASGAFISGNRDSSSNISVDGSNVQIPVYGQATLLQARAGVEEVRVESANMSPEFGNGVAAVNVITKTGSNTYHGELFEYFRNNHLDSNLFSTTPPDGRFSHIRRTSSAARWAARSSRTSCFSSPTMRGSECFSGSSNLPLCRTRIFVRAISPSTLRRALAVRSCRHRLSTIRMTLILIRDCGGLSLEIRFPSDRRDFAHRGRLASIR
jgi:hypothetical protein